jgi:hypothetical protein
MIKKNLSRRQFLKTVVVTEIGLTAAAFLPAKWVKPVISTGVLPVHAQTSGIVAVTLGWSGVNLPGSYPGTVTFTDFAVVVHVVPNKKVTLISIRNINGVLSNPNPAFPASQITGSNGRAEFGDLSFQANASNFLAMLTVDVLGGLREPNPALSPFT